MRGSDILSVAGFSTASKCNVSPTSATALINSSLTNDPTLSSRVIDDRMTYGDWSTINPSAMVNDGAGLQHRDKSRRLLSATLDFTEMVPRMSKAHDISRFSDFESSVSDPSNNNEVRNALLTAFCMYLILVFILFAYNALCCFALEYQLLLVYQQVVESNKRCLYT